MSLYEMVLRGSYAGQEVVNRWNYLSSGSLGTVTGSFGLISAAGFIADGIPPEYPADGLFIAIGELQVPSSLYIEVIAKNVYDPTDFYTLPLPSTSHGTNSGQGMSPINAYGLRSTQVRTDIRRGTKRFVGVNETDSEELGVLSSGALELLQHVADVMSASLGYDDEGSSLTFAPCIVGKKKYTTPSGKTAYEYYPTEAEQLTHLAVGITWQPYTQVRSQVSRQYGKGK